MIIEIVIENNVNGISVSVTNQGPEIPTEHLPHVFERLYRVDAARREGNIENVGLGLAITKSIINMHGGTIAVTSANGLTCFKFILPQP